MGIVFVEGIGRLWCEVDLLLFWMHPEVLPWPRPDWSLLQWPSPQSPFSTLGHL